MLWKKEGGRVSVTLSALSTESVSWCEIPSTVHRDRGPLLWHDSQVQEWAMGHGVWRGEGRNEEQVVTNPSFR